MAFQKLSIVVPVYNDSENLPRCLQSIFDSSYTDFEVILVDDGSVDNSYQIGLGLPCKILRHEKNMGVSAARNTGARHAKGEIIYFTDSDIVQEKDTIKNILKHFGENKDLEIICGYWSKDSLQDGLFPEFLGLKHCYLALVTNKNDFDTDPSEIDYTVINSSSFAIKKNYFLEVGGFDEGYGGAGCEEYELSRRVRRRGDKIMYFRDVRVKHHFKGMFQTLRLLFIRTSDWVGLFIEDREFEKSGNATKKEAITVFLVLSFFSCVFLGLFKIFFVIPAGIFLCLFLLRNFRFYFSFLLGEKGVVFALYSILFDLLIYLFIGLGSAYGLTKIRGGKK